MEKNLLIDYIKSKYVSKHIYNFIKDKNFAKKLFFYSKCLQNKLDINYSYCYKKNLNDLHFDLNDYLYQNEKKYEKELLKKK